MGKPNNKKTYPSLEKLFEMWESYKNWKREQKLNKLLND
jgi:hypothetical protein